MTDIFERLESNNREAIENAKETLREQFMKGMYELKCFCKRL